MNISRYILGTLAASRRSCVALLSRSHDAQKARWYVLRRVWGRCDGASRFRVSGVIFPQKLHRSKPRSAATAIV